MKVISLWQPYASLLVGVDKLGMRMKAIETRPYPTPASVMNQRLGIASTKIITSTQRTLFADEKFQTYYRETGLPAKLDDMLHGYLLGSVEVYDCELMTEETLEDVTDEEQVYGDWRPGRYAWRTRNPEILAEPVRVSGQQGIWNLNVAQVLTFRSAAQKR